MDSRPVLVLGAGFTKAFFPRAPLLVDDYGVAELSRVFEPFRWASAVLALESARSGGHGKINIERLMSRLDGGMPYDAEAAQEEFRLLLSFLKRALTRRIRDAQTDETNRLALAAFAQYCVSQRVSVITFNYDDALDSELWRVKQATSVSDEPPYWHPDGGYGFFCRPAISCVVDTEVSMDPTTSLLLKLHGSLNWRIRRGSSVPYVVDAIVHQESWYEEAPFYANVQAIEAHLESEPFIVPPVLLKAGLIAQPILRAVWQIAREQLASATDVTFVGYSMPLTDIAATFLFAEALSDKQAKLRIVDYGDENECRIKTAYRSVFPSLADEQFDFSGALNWATQLQAPHP